MTICIAAICEEGQKIVVAADQMFTVGAPLNVEFEPELSKIEEVVPGCVVLAAGNSLYADEVIKGVRSKLVGGQPSTVKQVCSSVKDEYANFRADKLEEQIIQATLGKDLSTFRAKGGFLPAYLQTQPNMYQQILVQSTQFNLGLDLMVAGTDAAGTHIAAIGNPGTMYFFDKLGYNAIGSGAVHAAIKFYLGGQTPKSSLADTLFAVYDAKRAAEVAPGVGRQTEVAVIARGDIWICPQALLDEITTVYEEQVRKAKPSVEKIRKKYDEQRKTG